LAASFLTAIDGVASNSGLGSRVSSSSFYFFSFPLLHSDRQLRVAVLTTVPGWTLQRRRQRVVGARGGFWEKSPGGDKRIRHWLISRIELPLLLAKIAGDGRQQAVGGFRLGGERNKNRGVLLVDVLARGEENRTELNCC
jgi:hypothetical protein